MQKVLVTSSPAFYCGDEHIGQTRTPQLHTHTSSSAASTSHFSCSMRSLGRHHQIKTGCGKAALCQEMMDKMTTTTSAGSHNLLLSLDTVLTENKVTNTLKAREDAIITLKLWNYLLLLCCIRLFSEINTLNEKITANYLLSHLFHWGTFFKLLYKKPPTISTACPIPISIPYIGIPAPDTFSKESQSRTVLPTPNFPCKSSFLYSQFLIFCSTFQISWQNSVIA